ncbi:MAG: acyl carrier protein [Myxococcales bacterium]|nr:acyl carrier protein [Myxococcales bacterium]
MSHTLDRVVELVRETLALPAEEEILASHLLFYDLGFTSMDLLDLIFRLEETFSVTIAEGTLYTLAKGELSDEEFCVKQHLTGVGRKQLMAMLSDTPREVFHDRIHAKTLPRYCTVAAFARLVANLED